METLACKVNHRRRGKIAYPRKRLESGNSFFSYPIANMGCQPIFSETDFSNKPALSPNSAKV